MTTQADSDEQMQGSSGSEKHPIDTIGDGSVPVAKKPRGAGIMEAPVGNIPSPGTGVARVPPVCHMGHLQDYEILTQLGKGTFGEVFKARQKATGKLVALKKFIVHDRREGFPITSFREITIMRRLRNIHVLQIIDMIHERPNSAGNPPPLRGTIPPARGTPAAKSSQGFFYTVMPYISSDLNGLLHNPHIKLTIPQIKCIMKQTLEAVDYIHSRHLLHRDIKTANILLDYFGTVKLADFGLARSYEGTPPENPNRDPGGGHQDYTGLVVTRWYRAPELLLGVKNYTTAIDMWGMGCVFGELYHREPILQGKSDADQAVCIFQMVGSPTEQTWPKYQALNHNKVDLSGNFPSQLEARFFKLMGDDALQLLAGLLALDPYKRYNARRALAAPYFTAEPVACRAEDLPKFEESHESDNKKYEENSHPGSREVPHGNPYGNPRGDTRPPPRAGWTATYGRRGGRGGYPGFVSRRPWTQRAKEYHQASSRASGSDLYGSEADKGFSAMRQYLHRKK